MRTLRIVLLIGFFISQMQTFSQNHYRKGEMEIRALINTPLQAQQLKALNLNGDYYYNNTARLYVVPKELEVLRSLDIDFEVLRENLDTQVADWLPLEAYHTYDQIIALMDSLDTAFPSICKKVVVGTSVEGRELSYLIISDNVDTDEAEPEIIFDGGIHGDEIGCAENVIRFARQICKTYATNTSVSDLVNSREIFLYPMVNPDGRVNMERYNANGIDLNRDWGYMWNDETGTGSAYSQVETKALRGVMYENQFVVHTTYHSGIEYISHPWSYRSSLSADHTHVNYLAGLYASTSGYSNIPYGPGNTGMYPINGSSKDANYGINGSVSWSLEISEDKQPPASQILTFYNYNVPAMFMLIEYSGYGINGIVVDSITGEPVPAVVFVDELFPVYADPTIGDFHKYVKVGTYDITIKANGYKTKTFTNITVDADGTDLLNFELAPQSSNRGIYKIVSSQIPDNNSADEGLTHRVIGEPDGSYYSIGKNGWMVFDMQDTLFDTEGFELTITEGNDGSNEGYTVYASNSMDGPFTAIGDGVGTQSFDFATSNVLNARYIKITDDGDGTANVDNAGFDLDAATALPASGGAYIVLPNYSLNEVSGNGNNRIDAGETFEITITLQNNGDSLANNLLASLTDNSEYVTMLTNSGNYGTLNPSATNSQTFTFETSESAPEATAFQLMLAVSANNSNYNKNFTLGFTIGLLVEDFETGDFTAFDWQFSGDANWQIIDGANVYEGSYSAQSMDIDDNEEAVLFLTANVPMNDSISFYRKVSCEDGSSNNWDYLSFLIDDVEKGRWDGELAWSKVEFPVSSGEHTFKWIYHKDVSVSGGSDCAWIDFIVLPVAAEIDTVLTAEIIALPQEVCSGSSVQLVANVNGGSGNYTYNWHPGNLMNDSTISNPILNTMDDVTVTLEVNDGNTTESDFIEISVLPVPVAPIITQNGNSLSSNIAQGNQWYNQDGIIEGATEQTYTPVASGTYYATVSNEYDCESEASNSITMTVGIDELVTASAQIYPNPSKGSFIISVNKENLPAKMSIYSVDNRLHASYQLNSTKTQIKCYLNKGLYFVKIESSQGISTQKLIIE